MKNLTLVAASVLTFYVSAQNIGINDNGATPNANAILDIDDSANDKGILIPRVSSGQRAGIAGLGLGEEGLTVYDETTDSYWLWDGIQWVQFMMEGNAWTLAGNTGTNAATNFLGTTDPTDFVTRTNNAERMRVTSAGLVGIGTPAPTQALDIEGSIRVRGGGPTAGDVLMSQDALGNATWSTSGYGLIPIGSIVAWHGNLGGVPTLPAGWVECDGSLIADAASPMNGQTMPDLNNATTSESGDVSRGRFLRGNTVSGFYQQDLANNLDWVNHDDSGNGDAEEYLDDDGTVTTIRNYSTSGDRFQINVDGFETRVSNMSVRWIMRIK
jgi:hypothetical protein